MIGKRAENVLNRALRYAFERQHEYFTLEHVFLSLLDEEDVQKVITNFKVSIEDLKPELEEHIEKEVPRNNPAAESDSDTAAPSGPIHPVATLSIQRLIQRALFHVQSSGKDEITPLDLLVALYQAKDSFALVLLNKHKIDRLEVLDFISHGIHQDPNAAGAGLHGAATQGPSDEKSESTSKARTSAQEALAAYTVSLNEYALKDKIDPLVGRSEEIERIVQTLCRRRKNNPLLVGEAGVGKTAIVEGLALRIINEQVPKLLKEAEVYSLDLGALLAGTKFRGDFEQRLKRVLKALQDKKDLGGHPVLFIDEIHTIIGAGAVSGGAMDAANLLKPFLSRGEIQCIGSTTHQEYRSIFEKDHALARRFQKIDVNEPTQEQAIQILQGLKSRFEEHHELRYTNDAIKTAVELSAKHITDRFLPDKAIDVLDEAGARKRLSITAPETEPKTLVEVNAQDIEELVSKIAKVPARSVNTNQKEKLKNLQRDLKITLFGQDHAIESITTAIRLAHSGLRTGERPVGSFLFCGPTGVGKTELTKQLALSMGIPFLRFDMSEYMEKHTVSRLIGAPPGYVGFEQAGLLTDAVLKQPHSVILLDEIEKAHPDLMNILLQVMDHGFLTDNNGRKADFRNAILIMTSNVGTRESEKRSVGFESGALNKSVSAKEVERFFSPEFRNRLDSIVYFNKLDPVTIAQVVGKQLLELESQLLKKSVEIEIDADVREWLAQKGYDPALGARPMARLIQDQIKKPLSEEILFGKLENGGSVKVRLSPDKEKLVFDLTPKLPPSEPQEREAPAEVDVQDG